MSDRETTGQHQAQPQDVLRELDIAARHGRTAWKVAVGIGSVLVTIASLLFVLARQSFEAGREAQRIAGQVVTREEARAMVKDAVDPLAHRLDKCGKLNTCCADIERTLPWIDWSARCIEAVTDKIKMRCAAPPRFILSTPGGITEGEQ